MKWFLLGSPSRQRGEGESTAIDDGYFGSVPGPVEGMGEMAKELLNWLTTRLSSRCLGLPSIR